MNFTGDENNIKEYKAWLFQENIRMEAEKKAMDAEKKKILKMKRELEEQKYELQHQMHQLSEKIRFETDRRNNKILCSGPSGTLTPYNSRFFAISQT